MLTKPATKIALTVTLTGALLLGGATAEARRARRGDSGRSDTTRVVVKKKARKARKVVVRKTRRPRVVVSRRTPRKVVVRKAPRRVVRKRVVVRRRPVVRRKVVHVYRPAPPPPTRKVVHVHTTDTEATMVETVETEGPTVDGYVGANLTTFAPQATTGMSVHPDNLGLNVNAGLRFDDQVAVEFGWTGTATGAQDSVQAGTLDFKAFMNAGHVRPFVLLGAGIYAVQDEDLAAGEPMVGPGLRFGAGVEIGNGPLSANVGAIWQGMALAGLDDPSAEAEMSGVSLGAGVALSF